MSEQLLYILSRLKNAAVNGHVAGAEDIVDNNLNMTQEQINSDTYRKNETYSKQQLDYLSTTPSVEYVNLLNYEVLMAFTRALTAWSFYISIYAGHSLMA